VACGDHAEKHLGIKGVKPKDHVVYEATEGKTPDLYEHILDPMVSATAEAVNEAVSAELLKQYAVPGKSVVLPDNQWWTIKSRDLASNEIVLRLSDYAIKDGAKKEADKSMSWDAFSKKVGSAWGIAINGKQYGPGQDKEKRAKLRASNGLRAAPGAPSVTKKGESMNESITTKNEEYGFYGTSKVNSDLSGKDTAKLFDIAARKIKALRPKLSDQTVQRILDSKFGRHLADELSFHVEGSMNDADVSALTKAFDSALKKGWVVKSIDQEAKAAESKDYRE
jgi:hypothetical protein